MGAIGLFSSSSYDEPKRTPNPDPMRYTILQSEQVGKYCVLTIQYHGCLMDLGVIDQAEVDRRKAERDARGIADAKAQRLAQWRRLNKEFEGTPPEPKPIKDGSVTARAMGWIK